jgi:hypothetical protein
MCEAIESHRIATVDGMGPILTAMMSTLVRAQTGQDWHWFQKA